LTSRRSRRDVENLGRNWLVNELHHAGITATVPDDNKLIDLIAYPESSSSGRVVPMQMIAASKQKFEVNRKYGGIAGLLMVYVWNLQSDEPVEAYAMSYVESVEIARRMDWTETESWQQGKYFTSKPSQRLLNYLKPYRMTPATWQERIRG
jgi:hypothetical protein